MRLLFSIVLVCTLSYFAKCDEGMWLPNSISESVLNKMFEKGLKVSAEDIYNTNAPSMKDAVVSLSWGSCTGELISSDGLMLTNHHCVDDLIQFHSSKENDFMHNGFWAMKRKDELPNKNLTASILVSIENVTERVVSQIRNLKTEDEKRNKIKSISEKITNTVSDTSKLSSNIKSFYGGNEFYLFIYKTFKDVRLVGAPPASIGAFGGDSDNWMWPRHTGDFALLRIYADTNNEPAEYSKYNVPYKPKYHFKIQLDGVDEGDFTMVYGFPGTTDRYSTSYAITQALKVRNKTIIDIRKKKMEIIKNGMQKNRETYLKYITKYNNISNYWKYYIGQSRGLRKMKVVNKKKSFESLFKNWMHSGGDIRIKKYKNVLPSIESAYKKNEAIVVPRIYLNEAIFSGPEILYFSYNLQNDINKFVKSRSVEEKKQLLLKSKEFFKNYDPEIDRKLLSSMLKMYYENVPEYQHAEIFKKLKGRSSKKTIDFEKYSEKLFQKSIFSSEKSFNSFLDNPVVYKSNSDPAFELISSIYDFYKNNLSQSRKEVRDELKKNNRKFISGIREMNSSKDFYADANSTLRISFGNVTSYSPSDAVHFNYFTTISGVFEKQDSSNIEYTIPKKLFDLYFEKNYGRYASSDGELRVNFIDNNDITGGNSGSPVINKYGELVGTAFDGNWEAMSGDIAYEKDLQRCISVDIRYVLFIIDKFAGATHLIDEMSIAKSRKL